MTSEDGFAVSASSVDETLAAVAAGVTDAATEDKVALLSDTGAVADRVAVDLVSLMLCGSALPANAEDGFKPEIAGGESMVKAVVVEITPSVVTVTVAVPGFAIRLEGIAASSCVESL